jgi:hypothetical protein
VDEAMALEKLDEIWPAFGPSSHRHAAQYRKRAERLLKNAAILTPAGEYSLESTSISAELAHCRVALRPDLLHKSDADGTLIAGRVLYDDPKKGDANENRVALYRRAAEQAAAGGQSRTEIRYIANGEVRIVEPPATAHKRTLEDNRLNKYDEAAIGIAQRQFDPTTNTEECRDCAYRLLCPK